VVPGRKGGRRGEVSFGENLGTARDRGGKNRNNGENKDLPEKKIATGTKGKKGGGEQKDIT